ncbi:Zinc finger protein 853, partial [Apaloderma vittatum]
HPRGRPNKCKKCQECFSQRKNLITHERFHSTWSRKKYWCSFCGQTFSHPSNLVQRQRIHAGDRPYECSECPRRF